MGSATSIVTSKSKSYDLEATDFVETYAVTSQSKYLSKDDSLNKVYYDAYNDLYDGIKKAQFSEMVKLTDSEQLLHHIGDNNNNSKITYGSLSRLNNIMTSQKNLKRSTSLRSWNKSLSRESLTSVPKQAVIVRHDSEVEGLSSHPSTSPPLSFGSSLPEFNLKQFKSESANLDFLQKSNGKVQRSFRNLKYYARNLTPERDKTPNEEASDDGHLGNSGKFENCISPRGFPILPSRAERKFTNMSTFAVNRFSSTSPEPYVTDNSMGSPGESPYSLGSPSSPRNNELDSIALLDEVISQEQRKDAALKKTYPEVQSGQNVARYLMNGEIHRGSGDSSLSTSSTVGYDTDSDRTATRSINSQQSKQQSLYTADGYEASEISSNMTVPIYRGQTRHTGWLTVKHILIPRKTRVELAPRRHWHKYWVKLKDCNLYFCDLGHPKAISKEKFSLSLSDGLAQAVPEHAKKEHVFCLTTNTGHAYLMQASSESDVENWIRLIHCECAMVGVVSTKGVESNSTEEVTTNGEESISRKRVVDTIQRNIDKKKNEIDMDEKMKKMAELQMTLVSETNGRKAIVDQISQWSSNLERNQLHVYRLRCYLSSLRSAEPPTSHHAMSSASKTSKQLLSALKLFNISSLMATVYAKECDLNAGGKTHKRQRKLSGLLNVSTIKRSGSFNDSPTKKRDVGIDPLTQSSPGKSGRIKNVFNSLRGLENAKGSWTGTLGRKKIQRSAVSAVFSSSNEFSNKENERKVSTLPSYRSQVHENKTNTGNKTLPRQSQSVIFQRLKSFENYQTNSSNSNNGATLSDAETSDSDKENHHTGSLDSLLMTAHCDATTNTSWHASSISVLLPSNETINIAVNDKTTIKELLNSACQMHQLNTNDYFIRASEKDSKQVQHQETNDDDLVNDLKDKQFSLIRKFLYSVQFTGNHGMSLDASGVVTEVRRSGHAWLNGIRMNDEVVLLNGKLINEMSVKEINKQLKFKSLRLLVRTKKKPKDAQNLLLWIKEMKFENDDNEQISPPSTKDKLHTRTLHLMALMEAHLESITVAPPPVIHEAKIHLLTPTHKSKSQHPCVVPPPDSSLLCDSSLPPVDVISTIVTADSIAELLAKSNVVSSYCRQLHVVGVDEVKAHSHSGSFDNSEKTSIGSNSNVQQRILSDEDKLDKVLDELATTERVYVKDLECLINRFLMPLRTERFIPEHLLHSLLHAVEAVLTFQKSFMLDMVKVIQEKHVGMETRLMELSLLFLRNSSRFKMYSSFCSNHSEIVSVLEVAKSNSEDFREFLSARNPNQQHSSSMESYLIKPIQRILKYPLLLREILSLSPDEGSTKLRSRLHAAVSAMDGVARHINDMQSVYEELGEEFTVIMKQAVEQTGLPIDILPSLDIAQLSCFAQLTWLNPGEQIFTDRKVAEMDVLLFGFRNVIVLLCRESKPDKRRHSNGNDGQLCFVHTLQPQDITVKTRSNDDDTIWYLIESSTESNSRFRFKSADSSCRARTISILQVIVKSSRKKQSYGSTFTTDGNDGHSSEEVTSNVPLDNSKDESIESLHNDKFNISDHLFYTPPPDKSSSRIGLRRSSPIKSTNKNAPFTKWRNTTMTQQIQKLPIHRSNTQSENNQTIPQNKSIFYVENKGSLSPKTARNNEGLSPKTNLKPRRYNMVYGVQPFNGGSTTSN